MPSHILQKAIADLEARGTELQESIDHLEGELTKARATLAVTTRELYEVRLAAERASKPASTKRAAQRTPTGLPRPGSKLARILDAIPTDSTVSLAQLSNRFTDMTAIHLRSAVHDLRRRGLIDTPTHGTYTKTPKGAGHASA